jgi:hypothetical protein
MVFFTFLAIVDIVLETSFRTYSFKYVASKGNPVPGGLKIFLSETPLNGRGLVALADVSIRL